LVTARLREESVVIKQRARTLRQAVRGRAGARAQQLQARGPSTEATRPSNTRRSSRSWRRCYITSGPRWSRGSGCANDKRMTNNVPEFAHIDELETGDTEPATDGGSSSN
jgi:hypothetical protein